MTSFWQMSRTSNPVSKAMSNNYNQKCDGEQSLIRWRSHLAFYLLSWLCARCDACLSRPVLTRILAVWLWQFSMKLCPFVMCTLATRNDMAEDTTNGGMRTSAMRSCEIWRRSFSKICYFRKGIGIALDELWTGAMCICWISDDMTFRQFGSEFGQLFCAHISPNLFWPSSRSFPPSNSCFVRPPPWRSLSSGPFMASLVRLWETSRLYIRSMACMINRPRAWAGTRSQPPTLQEIIVVRLDLSIALLSL